HVLAALDEVMRNRTTFVIAHRLATIRNATRILVFDHGRIVEMGTFQELQRSGGVFTRLITEQFAGLGASEEPAMQVRPQ
ncbi:MAG: glucan ABC transporter ATP-binding protein/ permease, partial [Pseudolabrys sp.]